MPQLRLSQNELARRAQRLRLLLLDVDGVLTDGRIVVNDDGVETKHFSVRDGAGIAFWRKTGRSVGILSGRATNAVAIRAAELGIEPVVQGAGDKGAALGQIFATLGLTPDQVGFMGDDLPDLPVLTAGVGLSACPADADPRVRTRVDLVTEAPGGQGAVRELIEIVLDAAGEWEPPVASFLASSQSDPDESRIAAGQVPRTWTPTREAQT